MSGLKAQITHRFDGFSLDATFEARAGVTALFGPSGSGKSTIINAVAGLFRANRADIALNGTPFQTETVFHPPHRRALGLVFQDARLFPHMSVAQNLDYARRFTKRPMITSRDDVISLLDLAQLLDRRPGTLSGGEKQRVAIGRALLSAPQMLLMDEPLASLDASRKAEILPYLERLKVETNLPILYVSHSMDEVARLADHLVLLDAGRVAKAGPLFDVLSDPAAIPLIGVREAGAVISATVAEHEEDGLTRLTLGSGVLHLPGVQARPGSTIRLRVLASEVILSLDPPHGLSAMNALPVTITAIHEGTGPGAAVVLDAAGDRLLARVTSRTVARLNLRPGLACHAILKSMSVAPAAIGH